MNLKPKFWNADKIVSFSAILISLATMGVYIYQTHLIQKQQSASVMPYLMISSSSYNPKHFVIQLSNNGLGPAMIEKVNVHYENKVYKNLDLPTFFWRNNPNKKDSLMMNGITYNNVSEGQLIPAGNTINILEINENQEKVTSLNHYFWETKKPVELEIIFASIYGEKWSIKGLVSRPKN